MSDDPAHLTLEILKQIRSRLDSIDGRLDGIDGRLDSIDGRLDGIDGRLDGIDGRLDGIDGRLDDHDRRFDRMDERFDRLEATTARGFIAVTERLENLRDTVGAAVRGNSRALLELQERVERLERAR